MSYVKFYDESENVEDELRRFFFLPLEIFWKTSYAILDDSGILKASNVNF